MERPLAPRLILHMMDVVIYDTKAQKKLAHFRAHDDGLSFLTFDPSGTLLATASGSGCEFHVYQILPGAASHQAAHHIYTLLRGRTSVKITDISFSADSRWLAVSAARGTTHIYAINVEGGPANIHTHIPGQPIPIHELPFIHHSPQPKLLEVLHCGRISQTAYTMSPSGGGKWPEGRVIASFGGWSSKQGLDLFILTEAAVMTHYYLKPHPPDPATAGADKDPRALELAVEATFNWDLGRRSSTKQLLESVLTKEGSTLDDSKSKGISWLSNVEISTHPDLGRQLWAGPQFSFKTFTGKTQTKSSSKPPKTRTSSTSSSAYLSFSPALDSPIFDDVLFETESVYAKNKEHDPKQRRQAIPGALPDLDSETPAVPSEQEDDVRADLTLAMNTLLAINEREPEMEFGPSRSGTSAGPSNNNNTMNGGGRFGGGSSAGTSSARGGTTGGEEKKPHPTGGINLAAQPAFTFYNDDADRVFE
jgi:hypothetical protein